jgi:hypothetical protein
VVTLQASPPTPLVAIDTDAKQGSTDGIQVGNAFYPAASQIADPRLQIVVLDRRTLAPVAFGGQSAGNKIYGCSDDDSCATQIKDDLKPLQDDVLVIASCQPGFVPRPGTFQLLIASLESIGVDPPRGITFTGPGQFAAVGIPGLPAGEARTWESAANVTTPGIKGALVKDQFDSYKLVSTHFVDFDTRAGGDAVTSNVMQIGTQKYSAQLPAGAGGGFQVVVLSGFDLSLQLNEMIVTAPAAASNVTGELANLSRAIGLDYVFGERPVVLVTSIGFGTNDARHAIAAQWNQLADFIGAQGGTQAAIQGFEGSSFYSLAGAGFIGQAMGTEVGPGSDPARITGVLTRDADWRFAASGGDELGSRLQPSLLRVIYQPATPWPAYNPAAMAWIANQVSLPGSDIRVDYWTQTYSETVWLLYQTAITNLKFPGDGKGFSRSDFSSLQTELGTEIGWLIKAKDFLTGTNGKDGLSQPFTDSVLKDWARLEDIATAINEGVHAPKQASAFLEPFVAVLGDLFDIASLGVGEAFAPAFELVGSTLAAGSEIASSAESGESVNDRYTTTVANYGVELVKRMTDIQSAYERLLDIAVSDWAKLCTLGTRQRCDPQSGGPSGPQLWQWTQDDRDQASLGLQQWSRRDIWRALLPAKFPLAFLKASEFWQTKNEWTAFPWTRSWKYSLPRMVCAGPSPFADLPASAQAQLASETGAIFDGYELWMIGKPGIIPEASITDPLWQPPDPGGDPFKGGLGFHPNHFFFRAWPQAQDYVNLANFFSDNCWFPPLDDTPAPPAAPNRSTSRSRADSSETPSASRPPGAKPKPRPYE